MAKKDNKSAALAAENTAQAVGSVQEEPVLYESEAYGDPQPDEGTKTTIMKPVGIGGPVPIVAPKHNTIQLQPIVVPLALVPYMTQDSAVLRTDGAAPSSAADRREYSSAVEFDSAEQTAVRKRTSVQKRVFSFFMLLMSALLVAAFLLAHFHPDIHPEFSLAQADVIGQITRWAEGSPFDYSLTLVNAAAAALVVLAFLASLFGLVFGKFPRKTLMLLFLGATLAYVAEIIQQVIAGHFDPVVDADVLVMLCVAGLAFILSVIFAAVCIRREDREDDMLLRTEAEI